MPEAKVKNSKEVKAKDKLKGKKNLGVKKWQKPTLEDVSKEVMAQPYIRFT